MVAIPEVSQITRRWNGRGSADMLARMGVGRQLIAGRALLQAAAAASLALGATPSLAAARAPAARAAMLPARIAYVTDSETTPARVWVASSQGTQRTLLGPGTDALMAPDEALVAANLFGAGSGGVEAGPALALYATGGAPARQLLDLATATATPLAFSPDSRYLAISLQSTAVRNIAAASGLVVLDTTTGRLTTVAHGIIYGASFARDGSDQLIYGRAGSLAPNATVDLYESQPEGTHVRRLTKDGRSLNPLWGPGYIVYDHERMRPDGPEYQLWLRTPGGHARQLTRIPVSQLAEGLVPVAFSSSGSRLVAEFDGEDTSQAWTVRVPAGTARAVLVGGHTVMAGGISPDGSALLVDEGGLEGPLSQQSVASMPFGGSSAHVLVAHAGQASWGQ
jgi:hypothetical protein